jgi:two-component system chemotaxis response regulator CheB
VIKLLVVDDSALVRKLLGKIFSAEGDFDIQFAANGRDALEANAQFQPDVITLDIHMPDMNGLECLDRIMIERPCPVVMVSSLTAEGGDATFEALRQGAVDFVAKPTRAISLGIDELGLELVAKVRAAAVIRLRPSLRLRERVRHNMGEVLKAAPRPHLATPRSKPGSAETGLVLVGTSTGGPPALEALLEPLPADFRWPILVAQHMPVGFTASLAKRLNGLCNLRVEEVINSTLLQPGTVYIGRGDADITVRSRAEGLVAEIAPSQPGYPWHPSTDRLVRTAMAELNATRLIGVLMTGMGNDGAEAMRDLRNAGGRTIAEAESTAVVWGMPGELVRLGGADWVAPLPEIASRLLKLLA